MFTPLGSWIVGKNYLIDNGSDSRVQCARLLIGPELSRHRLGLRGVAVNGQLARESGLTVS